MHDWFDRIYSWATFAAAIFAANLVALFKAWPLVMARLNERRRDAATERAADWDRLRQQRNDAREECDMVRDRWAECEADRVHWMARAMKAEAIVQGYGEARQLQAIDEAQKRAEKHKDNGG